MTRNLKKIILFQLLLFSITSTQVIAQGDEWTPEDIINTERVRSAVFSPNGKMVVWTKSRGVKKKDKFVSDLYLTRLDLLKDGAPRTFQLTNSDESDRSPLFSQDNETIYFLSSRDKGKKLWSMSVYGGEAKEVHEFKNGISNIKWLTDTSLSFVSNDGKSLYKQELEKSKDDTEVVEDSLHWTISKVYSFDTKEKAIKRLTNNDFPIGDYAVSKDGRYIITSHIMSRHYASDANPKATYYLQDLKSDNRTQILKDLQSPGNFSFTSDNQGFYFSATKSSDKKWIGAGIDELYYFSLGSNQHTKIDLDWTNGLSSRFIVIGNNLLTGLANGAYVRLAYYQKTGNTWKKHSLPLGEMQDHTYILGHVQKTGKLLYEYSTASKLPQYYTGTISLRKGKLSITNQTLFSKLNKNLSKKHITKSEVYTWAGANGDEVNGILYYPKDYVKGEKYPLMLSIHGGPAAFDSDRWSERWSTYPNLYAEKGAFILKPNYHGSSNHGQKFVESIKANYYDQEMIDIVNGINSLNDKGMVDMDKLGVMGWSNGAILTTMLTLRYPDMFKAAAPGAGDVNWTSDYGTCAFGVSFDQYYFGGAPWDDVNGKSYNEAYILKSPFFDIEKIKTPTIIFHGSNDRAVPRDQGWEYYRGLQQVGKAPVRFLWFPNQPHGLRKITHQLRKMKEEIAWFDQYLFEKSEPKNEAFKEGSPLAMLIEKADLSTVNGFYGVKHDEKLIPEMAEVKKDSISIGKFEITNAQFKTYQSNYTYKYGTGNHPVYNLQQQDIEEYITWINDLTGETYRLPSTKEATALKKKIRSAKGDENTLQYWAGYDLTPSGASLLAQKMSDMSTTLIREVGGHKAVQLGSAQLYDLKGNVSEYYHDGSTLKVYGYSAYDYADASNSDAEINEDYTGFRLIKE